MSRHVEAPPNGVGFNVFPVEQRPEDDLAETLPCGACGAEPHEPCRYGCLGAVPLEDLQKAEMWQWRYGDV